MAHARAGLHPTALEFVAERRIATLGSDGNSDTAPSTVEGVDFPVHVLAVNDAGHSSAGLFAVRRPRHAV